MAYLALYRKFRPSGFDGLIGQEHVVRTLVNQIASDKIGHAYLFCGARGTGKTSAAKIFARAINCERPVNGSPCGQCETCKKLSSSASLDIMEIDAASNNRVEEIRELRENVVYPPTAGRYKVYIVDEVHMLTDSAFNALLKTLEEPPAHAVFILATTEVHKLPATILSRCMRFDFRLIPADVISAHVAAVYDAEGKAYEKAAVDAIAQAGEGSIRDALSVADICLSYGEGKLTYSDVLAVLGASDRGKIGEMVQCLLEGRTGDLLRAVDELAGLGKGMGVLTRDITAYLRDLLVAKTCADANEILRLPADRFAALSALAGRTSDARILRALDIFAAAEGELRYSTHPRVVLEAAAVRAALPAEDYDLGALLARIKALEEGVSLRPATLPVPAAEPVRAESPKAESAPRKSAPARETAKPVFSDAGAETPPAEEDIPFPEPPPEEDIPFAPPKSREDFVSELSGKAPPVRSVATGERVPPERLFGTFVRTLRKKNYIMLWAVCQELKGRAEGDTLVVSASSANDYAVLTKKENENMIREVLAELGGWSFRAEPPAGGAADTFDDDVADIARSFGDKIVVVKE